MFVPPTLDFYPELIIHGPLKRQVASIVRAIQAKRLNQDRIKNLLDKYQLDRLDVAAKFLKAEGLGWCDLCYKLVPAFSVRSMYRHGSSFYMKTDCSYGDPFRSALYVNEVKSICALHGEVHEDGHDISFTTVFVRGGRVLADVDGEAKDVTSYDMRAMPSDTDLAAAGILHAFAEAVPPALELKRTGNWGEPVVRRFIMKDNPYVVIATREES